MKKGIGLLVGLCLFAGCENELPEQIGSMETHGDTFVVDYAAEAGDATRAIHDNQAKGVRINSLTYLLYNVEGALEKRREIPGLAGDDETWPLTREQMTWEQREALKDTLLQGETYHAVFVANIDPAVCDWEESPLQATESYATVRLQMPSRPFTDRNMFYLFTRDILSTDQGADREQPYSCPVLLRRVVTRTDFLFEQLPAWDKTAEGGESDSTYPVACQLPEAIQDYFRSDISQWVLSTYADELSRPVVEKTAGLLDSLAAYFTSVAEQKPDDRDWQAKYGTYKARLAALKSQVSGDGKATFLDHINTVAEGEQLSTFQTHLMNTLLNALAGNAAIQGLFAQSAQRTSDSFAAIAYEGSSGVNTYFIGGTPSTADLAESQRLQADVTDTIAGTRYIGFHWIGFADSAQNRVKKVKWYATKDTTDVAFELATTSDNTSIATGQGENEKYVICYRPIDALGLKAGWSQTRETRIICDLSKALPFDATTDAELKAAIEEALKTDADLTKYGSLTKTNLDITYPDLAGNDILEIKQAWEIIKNNE